jgi:DHA1 family bicyclomycin/chloramphenicol resistance-like MFS transporter
MSSISPAAEATSPPRHGLAFTEFVAIVAALMALNALAIDVMLPALGDIGNALAVTDPNERQKIVIVYLLGFGAAQLVHGPMSDRFGRRPVLLGGLALYAVAGLLSLVADTMDHLLLARLLQGVGCAAPRVVALSIVRDCYSGARMGRVMSLVMMVFMTVPVIAPSIGQLILFVAPWRAIFLMLTLGGFGMLIWCAARLGETLPREERRPLSLSAVLGAYATTLTTRVSLGYMLATTMIFAGLFAFIASAQQVYVDTFDLGPAFPLIFALIGSALAASSFLSASLVERIGLRPLSHWALVALCAIGLAQVAVALVFGSNLHAFTGLLLLTVFAFGLIAPNFNAIAMEPLGRIAGSASAMLGFVTTSGGAALGFLVSSRFDGTVLPLALGFAGFGLLGLAVVAWTERGRLFRL